MLDSVLVVGQVHAIADTGVTDDFKRENGVLVLGVDEREDGELLDVGLHGKDVLAGLEDQVGDERVADGLAVDEEVHGDVSEIERHDGRVGNVDLADEVGAVLEDLALASEDLKVSDVETLEPVKAC